MNFFLPNNLSRILTISVLCVVYAFMQALAFRSLVTFPFPQLMLDGMMNALFFTGVSFLLWKVVKYGNFETLHCTWFLSHNHLDGFRLYFGFFGF